MNLYFYREYGGKEVDLIVEDYKKTTPQSKSNQKKVKRGVMGENLSRRGDDLLVDRLPKVTM